MLVPGSSSESSAFPWYGLGWLPTSLREHDFSRDDFRGCSYFVMFRPLCLLASQIVPTAAEKQNPLQGSRGFYVRAERASLSSHASDMLSARLQAIGGTRTSTSQDSQLCRLLTPLPSFSERDAPFVRQNPGQCVQWGITSTIRRPPFGFYAPSQGPSKRLSSSPDFPALGY